MLRPDNFSRLAKRAMRLASMLNLASSLPGFGIAIGPVASWKIMQHELYVGGPERVWDCTGSTADSCSLRCWAIDMLSSRASFGAGKGVDLACWCYWFEMISSPWKLWEDAC